MVHSSRRFFGWFLDAVLIVIFSLLFIVLKAKSPIFPRHLFIDFSSAFLQCFFTPLHCHRFILNTSSFAISLLPFPLQFFLFIYVVSDKWSPLLRCDFFVAFSHVGSFLQFHRSSLFTLTGLLQSSASLLFVVIILLLSFPHILFEVSC